MLRLSSTLCPFCEARAFVRKPHPSWQFSRSAATLQKRKPSRMTLSSNVRKGSPKNVAVAGKGDREGRDPRQYGPFGAMNVTAAPFERRSGGAYGRSLRATEEIRRRSSSEKRERLEGRSSSLKGRGGFAGNRLSVREKNGFEGGGASVKPRDGLGERRPSNRDVEEPRREPRPRDTKRISPNRRKKDKDPMHALKMQSALTPISYDKRNRVKETLMERDSFDQFNLLPFIKESISTQALGGMVDISPTPIQRLALPALLERHGKKGKKGTDEKKEMQQFLLAAETGSGKTLAYVLPLIDAIKRAEAAEESHHRHETAKESRELRKRSYNKVFEVEAPPSNEPDPSTARPRALILLPTSELVTQIGTLVKNLSHTIKFRSCLLSSSYSGRIIRSRLFSTSGIDLVISTPHLLHSITETDPNILSRVTHLVIDEADSLFDRSFAPTVQGILDRARPSLEQLVLCSATIPKSLNNYLVKRFPDIRRLVTPNLHAIPRRVGLSVVDIEKIPYHGNRDLACAQVLWDIGKEGSEATDGREAGEEDKKKKVLVFVNEREKTGELASYLRGKGIDATALSRDAEARKGEGEGDVLAAFTGTGGRGDVATTSAKSLEAAFEPSVRITKHATNSGGDTFDSPGDLMDPPSPAKTQRQQQTLPTSPSSAISAGDLMELPPSPPPSPRKQQQPPSPTKPLSSRTQVLISTDLSSRGIDTLPLRHLILYDVPHTSIDFIHRLGRLGRMGRRGKAVVLVGRNDRKDVVREVREGMFRGGALV